MYKVKVQIGLVSDRVGDYSGIRHIKRVDAEKELKEALQSSGVYRAWIVEQRGEIWI